MHSIAISVVRQRRKFPLRSFVNCRLTAKNSLHIETGTDRVNSNALNNKSSSASNVTTIHKSIDSCPKNVFVFILKICVTVTNYSNKFLSMSIKSICVCVRVNFFSPLSFEAIQQKEIKKRRGRAEFWMKEKRKSLDTCPLLSRFDERDKDWLTGKIGVCTTICTIVQQQ